LALTADHGQATPTIVDRQGHCGRASAIVS
jgi:hypothetical protein